LAEFHVFNTQRLDELYPVVAEFHFFNTQRPDELTCVVTALFAEFHFFNTQRLDELYAKKRDWWNRLQAAIKEKEGSEKKDDEGEVVVDGAEIDAKEGWTPEEMDESAALLDEGFRDWSKKDFSVFKSACERHGRTAYESISQELENKDAEEVERYSAAFWKLGDP
ncbi:hypothetical protein T484DRAFT_1826401, partial [Baffinella frigidus]